MGLNRRLELQTLLETLLGSKNVYFGPPQNITLKYPCIVYKLDKFKTEFADNLPYLRSRGYAVTVIDRDPDSEIPDKVGKLPKCIFSRNFTTDNLIHNTYNLYF